MCRLITPTGLNSIKLVLGNPKFLITGTQFYFYEKGYFGKIPLQSIFSIFEENHEIGEEINLQFLATDVEGVTLTELSLLSWIAKKIRPLTIFEFGTSDGRTTVNFALNTSDNCKIYTLDLPEDDRLLFHNQLKEKFGEKNFSIPFKKNVGKYFINHPMSDKIIQIFGDSREVNYAQYFGKIDLIFIDANHDYECVKSDTQNAFKMLSDKGTIVWHDYPNWDGVCKYIDELFIGGLPLFRIQDTRLACYTQFVS
ncbi:MAG: class I SAM-dependent methyltransferase [Candidatus Helarchaeota archaeon]|nr:class I SAM-dependent methyltransferase [Candidatus Helarchaeota archaeon]